MKYSALNIDFNGVRLDPLGSRSPLYATSAPVGVPPWKRAISATVD